MEHLDLAGVITTGINWTLPAFDQQDAIYLSSSRQMLEPILEETSEDEEHAQNSWNQYENATSFWSSAESETGSVIRIELNKDADSISERDFACPAKRPRRAEDFQVGAVEARAVPPIQQSQSQPDSLDDTVLLRRYQRVGGGGPAVNDYGEAHSSLERFLAYEACARDSYGANSLQRSSTGSRRFDEFYSDSDSLSYQSLSRSSSLIQFESLERQLLLQEQHASMSSLGNSSPSLLSFDGANSSAEEGAPSGGNSGSNSGNNSRRGSQSSLLKRFESADGRLHQTYFDLDKLNFDDEQRVLFGAAVGSKCANLLEATVGEVKSDTESSSSSGSSSGHSILTASKPSVEDLTDASGGSGSGTTQLSARNVCATRLSAFQRGGKNSAENLSEDSGYCEPSTLRRAKSKSIPKNFEKFCEEEEEFQQDAASAADDEEDDEVDDDDVDVDDVDVDDDDEDDDVDVDDVADDADVAEVADDCDGIVGCDMLYQNTHSKNSNVIHYAAAKAHDICQPKINAPVAAACTLESNVQRSAAAAAFNEPTTAAKIAAATATTAAGATWPLHAIETELMPTTTTAATTTPTSGATLATVAAVAASSIVRHHQCYDSVKNSNAAATREQHRRSLAHSPSPVSSDASGSSCASRSSNSSASTCASAASFTWLPIQLQRAPQPPQQQHEEQPPSQPKQTLSRFCAPLRNSLPDIRDALSSAIEFSYRPTTECHGYGLEQLKAATTTTHKRALDDSDISTTSSPNTSAHNSRSQSDATDAEATPPETRKHLVGLGGKGNSGDTSGGAVRRARISSVPNELHQLGRKKRATRHKYSRAAARSYSSEEEWQPAGELEAEEQLAADREAEEDFFANTCQQIRRSCSWSERRNERHLHKFEDVYGGRRRGGAHTDNSDDNSDSDSHSDGSGERVPAQQTLGYMNASYCDLTLLDYSGHKPQSNSSSQVANHKRSDNMAASKRANSSGGDYERLICKGNFLLDELSEIYDKNASILNDKPVEEPKLPVLTALEPEHALEWAALASGSPKPPPRQHKHASFSGSSSQSEVDGSDGGGVQHVQLTIRKPPARQKHGRQSDATNSLLCEATNSLLCEATNSLLCEATNSLLCESVAGKTFDQDPTNLHTCYAQSLEKCNFDAKELSNCDISQAVRSMPKRRFHSQTATAKQRNMVSSTPNLNAYNPNTGEIEDDMYVSSAHTSMHQLPQGATQKPLGILLPTGSRSSFGKEVSFCPVVSKYSWQEQSSEEVNEAATPQEAETGQQRKKLEWAPRSTEESDDELLDNADATVIYNTRENELIAARYNEEQQHEEQQSIVVAQVRAQPQAEKLRATLITKEAGSSAQASNNIANDEERKTSPESENAQATKPVSTETTTILADDIFVVPAGVEQPSALEVSLKTTIVDAATSNGQKATHELLTIVQKAATTKATTASKDSGGVLEISDDDYGKNASARKTTTTPTNTTTQKVEPPTRPLSLHLPILSEPPTNRAHHILYASQQMLDNFQRREREERGESVVVGGSGGGLRTANSVNSLVSDSNGMYHYTDTEPNGTSSAGTIQKAHNNNNNNQYNKSKFKDEKHPSSKGFLSRFTNGFRFSLRRNKKKQLQQQKELQQQQQQQQVPGEQPQQQQLSNGTHTATIRTTVHKPPSSASNRASATADYVYIPLKGPLTPANAAVWQPDNTGAVVASDSDSNSSQAAGNTGEAPIIFAKVGAKAQAGKQSSPPSPPVRSTTVLVTGKVTGKPPLPPQLAHAQNGQHPQRQQQQLPLEREPSPTKLQQFYTDSLLDSERSYYDYNDFEQQLQTGMQANGCAAVVATGSVVGVGEMPVDAAGSPSRASVSQKTQMFNNLSGGSSNASNANGRAYAKPSPPHGNNHARIGLIETNLDTHETVITGKTRSLMDIGPQQLQQQTVPADGGFDYGGKRSHHHTMNVGGAGAAALQDDEDGDVYVVAGNEEVMLKKSGSGAGQIASVRRPHKSMEFLLDKENQKNVLPPENELQKSHEHNPAALSEHQLRIQASLQRLNIPDWFRQYNQNTSRSPDGSTAYKPGNFTRKRTTESGRWAGLNSKTTSLSSLGSQRSDRSPLLLSPSAHSHHGGQSAVAAQQQHAGAAGTGGSSAYGTGAGFSRWSTSHLNSSQTSPSVSQRGSFSRGGPVNSSFMSVSSGQSSILRNSYRQPYLGWRSTEKLSQRTPHERLATSLLAQQQRTSPTQRNAPTNGAKLQAVTPEIQTSIKEVTSAIVHYVNDQTQQQRSRSTSPNSRKCWLESSFVGTRPLDSPQTPIIEGANTFTAATANNNNNNYNYSNTASVYLNSSGNSSIHSHILSTGGTTGGLGVGVGGGVGVPGILTTNAEVRRMNGLSLSSGGESAILI